MKEIFEVEDTLITPGNGGDDTIASNIIFDQEMPYTTSTDATGQVSFTISANKNDNQKGGNKMPDEKKEETLTLADLKEKHSALYEEAKKEIHAASFAEGEKAGKEKAEKEKSEKSSEDKLTEEKTRVSKITELASESQLKLAGALIKDGKTIAEATEALLKDAQEGNAKNKAGADFDAGAAPDVSNVAPDLNVYSEELKDCKIDPALLAQLNEKWKSQANTRKEYGNDYLAYIFDQKNQPVIK